MTESEATKEIERHTQFLRENWKPYPDYDVIEALRMAISAIEEREQYREFKEIFESSFSKEGVKLLSDKREFASWLERGKWIARKCEELRVELDRFKEIGTVSEFRELKEKATAKKRDAITCPVCGGIAGSWSEGKE